ncbi:MAG: aminopeptidase C [Bacteroidales bacterium]
MSFFKSIVLCLALGGLCGTANAQNDKTKLEVSGYEFEELYNAPYSPVKNQYRSGTCWAFAGIGFLESEILRKGGDTIDLSEMHIVRNIYPEKARKYVQLHGKGNYSQGGGFSDVLYSWKKYGLVPENNYSGLSYGTQNHEHGELEEVSKDFVKGIVKNKNKKITPVWMDAFQGIMDSYFGEVPQSFEYKGKEYSPASFAASLNINPDDYVEITSYSHHPFYSQFALEIPDNWLWSNYYNVPLEDLTEIMHYALKKGYAVGWDADVSEKGFSHSKGVAILPDSKKDDLSGTEKEKWEKLTAKEKKAALFAFNGPVDEKEITQESRQEDFNNYLSKDDHLMVITGLAKDQAGKFFYKVKNSWATSNICKGFFYASTPFVQDKTISILVHKKAIPKKILKRLKIVF